MMELENCRKVNLKEFRGEKLKTLNLNMNWISGNQFPNKLHPKN